MINKRERCRPVMSRI